ncbi:hypothetical protein IP90_00750 [Luteimonas cucumeris]|uniref:Uncharacterized protein n=1 Tax=Luteimonas cucumeris TaxID=985012 RepID=A0A562LAC3_9GAMM|nr:hypothetical protein [Luteimonas cucumeris]TWI04617.1 hypothetical protein IP90_00750 [Luteimonas cucumeris]
MDTSYTVSVLPESRLQSLDAELASMEVILNLLRYADGDKRGVIPWCEHITPVLCRQVLAALELFGSELSRDFGVEEVRETMEAEIRVMRLLQAQHERLQRLLALTEEVAGAVGSDVMVMAMALHDELADAGRAGGITAFNRLAD